MIFIVFIHVVTHLLLIRVICVCPYFDLTLLFYSRLMFVTCVNYLKLMIKFADNLTSSVHVCYYNACFISDKVQLN